MCRALADWSAPTGIWLPGLSALASPPPHPSVVCSGALPPLRSGCGDLDPSLLFSPSFLILAHLDLGPLGSLVGIWQQGQEGDWVWLQWAEGRAPPVLTEVTQSSLPCCSRSRRWWQLRVSNRK